MRKTIDRMALSPNGALLILVDKGISIEITV
jgi:hypothetical protein